eukprot:5153106-Heterocapsa_arctica.AAC.1
MKKQYIPKAVKVNVWSRCAIYKQHVHITQCTTCTKLVYIPQSIRKHFNIKFADLAETVSINGVNAMLFGVGEFGHIVSEFHGGRAVVENLTIQCKECNVRNGVNHVTFLEGCECEMLDAVQEQDLKTMVSSTRCVGQA